MELNGRKGWPACIAFDPGDSEQKLAAMAFSTESNFRGVGMFARIAQLLVYSFKSRDIVAHRDWKADVTNLQYIQDMQQILCVETIYYTITEAQRNVWLFSSTTLQPLYRCHVENYDSNQVYVNTLSGVFCRTLHIVSGTPVHLYPCGRKTVFDLLHNHPPTVMGLKWLCRSAVLNHMDTAQVKLLPLPQILTEYLEG